jgi:hypothetical protein
VEAMFAKEESLKGYLKAAADDASQIEGEIQEEWNMIARWPFISIFCQGIYFMKHNFDHIVP